MRQLTVVIFLSIFTLMSCGMSKEQKIASAISEARFFLTHDKCNDAKKILDSVDYQNDNADYVKLYGAMYGCKAGYNEVDDLFGGNLDTMTATAGGFLASLATFNTSQAEVEADSDAFSNLFLGIQALLNSGSTAQPSAANRESKFGSRHGADINMQAIYMTIIALGKFVAYYGNADSTGTKGTGNAAGDSNTCYMDYSLATATRSKHFIENGGVGLIGLCAAVNSGHPDLDWVADATLTKTRLCQGAILYNNLLDILDNIALSGSDQLGDLGSVSGVMDTIYLAANAAEGATIGSPVLKTSVTTMQAVTSQSYCEDSISNEDITVFYAIMMEFGHQ